MEVIKENISNIDRIIRIAKLAVKEEFRGTKLGIFWEVFRTAVFFTIYAMFYTFIRGKTDNKELLSPENITKLLPLFAALLPYNLISTIINQTPRVYKKNQVLVTTIKFPLSIIPTFDIVAKCIIHIITIVIVIVLFALMGQISITFIQVIYYYICLFILSLGLMFTLSMVCSISNDAYKFWKVITRVFIYFCPVFWDIEKIRNL